MKRKIEPTGEPNSNDLAILSQIYPCCGDPDAPHGYMEKEGVAVVETDDRRYFYACRECGARVAVVFAKADSATERTISLRQHETELHPDDGVAIAEVGFHCAKSPEHGFMLRSSKRVIPDTAPPKTDYVYRCDCSTVRIVVDQSREKVAQPAR